MCMMETSSECASHIVNLKSTRSESGDNETLYRLLLEASHARFRYIRVVPPFSF